MGKLIDLTGQKFGTLTVIERDFKNQKGGHAYWRCLCLCGREVSVHGYSLRSGYTTSCGYAPGSNSPNKGDDLTGQVFHYWTVIQKVENSADGHAQYLCRCKCGTEKVVISKTLLSGHSQSCGCYKKELTSERFSKPVPVGSRFGELIVIEDLPETNHCKKRLCRCLCSCGQEIIVPRAHLRSGNTTSCGHIKSKGEATLVRLLQQKQIAYQPQWNDNGKMLLSSGYPCRFDFAIFRSSSKEKPLFLLEYNGSQHYKATNSGWDTEENLLRTQQRDAEKAKLCEEAGIPLEIIPYTDFDNLEEVLTKLLQKYNLYEN